MTTSRRVLLPLGRYAGLVVAVGLGAIAGVVELVAAQHSPWGAPGALGLWAVSFSGVGFVIAGRKPGNPIGWLLLGSGIFAGLNGALRFLALEAGPSVGLAVLEFSWVPAVAGLITALAVLPDGRLPSRRWRPFIWLLWLSVTWMGAVVLGGVVIVERVVVEVLLQVSLLPPLVAVAVRFGRSRGTERQQLKWIAYAGGLVVAAAASGEIGLRFFVPRWYFASTVVLSLAILCVPVAIAMAILKYRLYDIDRIISRTVGYSLVTAVLVGVYATVVFLMGTVLPRQSDLAVAASTLAVAALFNPVRRRVQGEVDRRFNRSRYDSQRIADGFGLRLRSEAGIDSVADRLLVVVGETMEPRAASLWLRGDATWK